MRSGGGGGVRVLEPGSIRPALSTPALYIRSPSSRTSGRSEDLVRMVKDISRWITSNIAYDVHTWANSKPSSTAAPDPISGWISSEDEGDCPEDTGVRVLGKHGAGLQETDVSGPRRTGTRGGPGGYTELRACQLEGGEYTMCTPSLSLAATPCCKDLLLAHREAGKEALRQGKATCRGYSDLLCLLCRFAGIQAVKIQGIVKTSAYIPGSPMHPTSPNHEWNAVWLQGKGWQLIDLTWAAGHVMSENPEEFYSEFTDHFLFTKPRDFVRDHLPTDPKWQLLQNPLSLSEFENDLFLKPGYFINGIKSCSLSSGVVHCRDECLVISFQLSQSMTFTYSLTQISSGLSLDQCVNYQWDKCQCVFRLYFPYSGQFAFSVYGKCTSNEREATRALLTTTIHSHWAGTPRHTETRLSLLLQSLLWGPTSYFDELGLSFLKEFQSKLKMHKSGKVRTPCFVVSRVDLNIAVVLYPCCSKVSAFGRGRLLQMASVRSHNSSAAQVSFLLSLKSKKAAGSRLWRLALFAQETQAQNKAYKCICNFLLETNAK